MVVQLLEPAAATKVHRPQGVDLLQQTFGSDLLSTLVQGAIELPWRVVVDAAQPLRSRNPVSRISHKTRTEGRLHAP
jgi:hypothetical protein